MSNFTFIPEQFRIMEAGALYEPPFSDLSDGGPEGLFAGRENVVEGIFQRLEAVQQVAEDLSSEAS